MRKVGIRPSIIVVPICLVSLGAVSAFSDQGQIEETTVENEAVQITRHFLREVRDFVAAKSESHEEVKLLSGKEFFSSVTGNMREVGGPSYLAFVSLTNAELTFLLNREERPDTIPSIDVDGNPTLAKDIHDQLVGISSERASEIALAFLKAAVGETELAFLCEESEGIQNRGSYLIYAYSWTECVDENGIADHLSRVNIELNPKNGRIVSFFRKTSRPEGENPIASSASRLISVLDGLEGPDGAQLKKRVPFRFWHEDGSSEDACEIQYRDPRDGPSEVSSFVVSLSDFRVLANRKSQTLDSGLWDASLVCP